MFRSGATLEAFLADRPLSWARQSELIQRIPKVVDAAQGRTARNLVEPRAAVTPTGGAEIGADDASGEATCGLIQRRAVGALRGQDDWVRLTSRQS